MTSGEFSEFYIVGSSERGRQLLRERQPLRHALSLFVAAPEAHKVPVPGSRVLGAGRYGYTFAIDNMAVKVTTPTSSQESFDLRRPLPPEDLTQQFEVLGALHEFLDGEPEGITAPEQFFVAHTPNDAYILGQQYMDGWVSVEDQTDRVYGWSDPDDEGIRLEVRKWTSALRERLTRGLGGFAYLHRLDDLAFHKPSGVHGGNLLVPESDTLDPDTPLCIIDQPGHNLRRKKKTST
ncbi:MAG TPA: hypothetical protein VJM32_02225 [Candidatus Saccharimonadales bacterium]|nr:hypothetical protein [Candidatus Saccharimonadales bacterium]